MNNELIIMGDRYSAMKEQAAVFVTSGLLPPTVKTEAQALVIAIKGAEVGLSMMQSFSHINIIAGKPTISTEAQNYLVRKNCPGAVIDILERSIDRCRIRTIRPGCQPCEFEFSMEDAKRAELLANPSWKKYPKAMLFARCFSEMARAIYPDCIGGISYSPEELGEVVNIDGEIVE